MAKRSRFVSNSVSDSVSNYVSFPIHKTKKTTQTQNAVVVAFSLFAAPESSENSAFFEYEEGLTQVCLALQDIESDAWSVRVALYVDLSIPPRTLRRIRSRLSKMRFKHGRLHVDVVGSSSTWRGMRGTLARFQALKDFSQTADAVVCMDVDLKQDTHWRRALIDWLNASSRTMLRLAMIDYADSDDAVVREWKMCAGFWGLKGKDVLAGVGARVAELASAWLHAPESETRPITYGVDQTFLQAEAWEIVKLLPTLTVQMVLNHAPRTMPQGWSTQNDEIWDNRVVDTLSFL